MALAGLLEPVLLDEWQAVPGVLGAVKRAIDSSPQRGRFIVTRSVRDDLLRSGWPVTGRLVPVARSAAGWQYAGGCYPKVAGYARFLRSTIATSGCCYPHGVHTLAVELSEDDIATLARGLQRDAEG